MPSERLTIIGFVEKYVALYSDKTFLREKKNGVWEETSFLATHNSGRVYGAGFMALGLAKGEKVALISEGRNQWIYSELGILYAGGVNVPLSFKLESDYDLCFRINHSDARFLIASESQIEKVRRVLPQCPAVEKVIVLDDIELREGEISASELMALGQEYMAANPGALDERMASVGPDDYANISYPSGTTADPKGILLTHRNYTANIEQCHSVVSVDEDDVMLIILPLDHCFAHVAGFYFMMSSGGSIATVPGGKNAITMLKNIPIAIREVRPHVMLSVPAISRNFRKNIETGIHKKGPKVESLYNFALKNAIRYNREYWNMGKPRLFMWWRGILKKVFDKMIFKSVRENFGGRMKFFVGGGALLDIELQRFFCAVGMPMFQGYGLSEATPIICSNAPGHAIFGSSGRVVRPMDIKICDDEGREVPKGERGEIVIRGENVMAGYWKNPESTAKTVVDGWLHTGDMGYMLDDEYLYVTGRFKSLLISADGEKYSPEGFEDSLTDGSKYIEQVILHNDMNPYTIVLVVPNKDALKEYVKKADPSLDADSREAKVLMLKKLQAEVDSYKKGGSHEGMFPERWLPAAIAVLPEAFTEKNGLVNSTMKIVRGKVEKAYADRIVYAYTAEGKELLNEKNIASL